MDRPQVDVGVVVAGLDVVDRIGARSATLVADAAVNAQDSLPLCMPFTRQSDPTIAARPLPGSHANLPERIEE